MAINAPFSAATAAYGQAARLGGGVAAPAVGAGGGDFANLLAQSLDGVVEAGRAADGKAMALVQGQGNVVDVVTAVAETELAVESMVAIRDRVISAYEEIMRMPI